MVKIPPPPTRFGQPAGPQAVLRPSRPNGPAGTPPHQHHAIQAKAWPTSRQVAPPPTRFGGTPVPAPARIGPNPAMAAQAKAAPALPPKRSAPAHGVIQRMEESMATESTSDPQSGVIGFGSERFRAKYAFTYKDFNEGAGFYTAAVAKLNGYVFGKYFSGEAGHAEDQVMDELQKVTFAARNATKTFLEPPNRNLLTIYITKSPCSSEFETSNKMEGCTELIVNNRTINGYNFDIKVRYDKLYTPKGIEVTQKRLEKFGPKARSEKAVAYLNEASDISAKEFSVYKKSQKKTTRRRGEAHPFRDVYN